jgi:hypothetical protein
MYKRARLVALAISLSMPVVLGTPALGAECVGVRFPDTQKVGNADLVLNGLGLRKATFLKVKVYVAGLYVPQKSGDAGQILGANQAWQLALHFVHDADASKIQGAFDEGFKKAAGDKLATLATRIEALKARMIDFQVGYTLSYTYDPAVGTVVDVNGARGAAIEGADFAAALLGITIGPEPPNEDLKTGVLGGSCE